MCLGAVPDDAFCLDVYWLSICRSIKLSCEISGSTTIYLLLSGLLSAVVFAFNLLLAFAFSFCTSSNFILKFEGYSTMCSALFFE